MPEQQGGPANEEKKEQLNTVVQEALFSLRLSDGSYVVLQQSNEDNPSQSLIKPISFISSTAKLSREYLAEVQDYLDATLLPIVQKYDPSIIESDIFCVYQDTLPDIRQESDADTAQLERIFWVKLQPKVEAALRKALAAKKNDAAVTLTLLPKEQIVTMPGNEHVTSSDVQIDSRCALLSQEQVTPVLSAEMQKEVLKNKDKVKKILRSIIKIIEGLEQRADTKGTAHQLRLSDIDRLRKLVSNEELIDKLEWSYLTTRISIILGQQFGGAVGEGTVMYSTAQRSGSDILLSALGMAGFITATLYGENKRKKHADTLTNALTDALAELASQYTAEQRSLALPDLSRMALDLPAKIGDSSQYLSKVWELVPAAIGNSTALLAQGRGQEAVAYVAFTIIASRLMDSVNVSSLAEKIRGKWHIFAENARKTILSLTHFSELAIQQLLPHAAAQIWLPIVYFNLHHMVPSSAAAEDKKEAATGVDQLRSVMHTLEIAQATLATDAQFAEFARGIVSKYQNAQVNVSELASQILPGVTGEAFKILNTPEIVPLFEHREINTVDQVETQAVADQQPRTSKLRTVIRKVFTREQQAQPVQPKQVRYAFLDRIFGIPDDAVMQREKRPSDFPQGAVFYDFTVSTPTQVFLEESSLVLQVGKVCEISGGGSFLLRTLADRLSHPNGITFLRLSGRDMCLHGTADRSHIGYYECDKVSTLKKDFFPQYSDEKVESVLQNTGLFTANEIKEYLTRRRVNKPLDMGRSFRSRLQIVVACTGDESIVLLDKPFRMLTNAEDITNVAQYIAEQCKSKLVIISDNYADLTEKITEKQEVYRQIFAEKNALDTRKFNTNSQQIERDTFTVLQLKQLLNEYKIDYSQWGTGEAKTLQQLVNEIKRGESQLTVENGNLVRVVNVSKVEVEYVTPKGVRYELVEDRQELPPSPGETENRVRHRTEDDEVTPLKGVAVKMLQGEDPHAAAYRALGKEVPQIAAGVALQDIVLVSGPSQKEEFSDSYPNLKSRYTTHRYKVVVKTSQPVTRGYAHSQLASDQPKVTHFRWSKQK